MIRPKTEQDAADVGPIELKEQGSPAWCWQIISKLQSEWNSINIDLGLYENTWEAAEEHRVWERVPYANPYGSKDEMLRRLELGDIPAARVKVAAKAMDTKPLGMQARPSTAQDENGAARHDFRRGSNNANYLMARIARDAPEVWKRMKLGEFESVAAAAREAGIKLVKPKKSVTLSENVDRVADRLRSHYSREQLRRIRELLDENPE